MQKLKINNQIYACTTHQKQDNLPYLLMLHGFMGDQRVFYHLISGLSAFCNPVTIDLLGYGQSSKPTETAFYEEKRQVKDLFKLIDELHLSPLYLYGYSMGGRLALQILAADCQQFEGAILESTTCGIEEEHKRKIRQQADNHRAQKIISDFSAFRSEWKKLSLFESPVPVNSKRVSRYLRIQAEQTPATLAASLRGFGSGFMQPVCEYLSEVSLPVLVLAGTADKKYMKISPTLASHFPHARFSALEAGHRIHLDNPEAWMQVTKQFITEYT